MAGASHTYIWCLEASDALGVIGYFHPSKLGESGDASSDALLMSLIATFGLPRTFSELSEAALVILQSILASRHPRIALQLVGVNGTLILMSSCQELIEDGIEQTLEQARVSLCTSWG